ncbi:MAG: hypothetical protein JW725_02585 [Candidatus Babeliaceae bacterium]|nr:hypothetical protein [Candidatus Babeliaceae bacterium]
MATTTLFVEILVIGTIAEIWIALILLTTVSPNATTVSSMVDSIDKLSTLLIIPFLALTYAVGWVVNFSAERLFKPIFQNRFRNRLFQSAGVDYYEARGLLFQKASEDVIEDLRFDRHILRISRSSVVNFTLIAITLALHFHHFNTYLLVAGIIISAFVAIISFFQWVTRYKSNYSKMLDTYTLFLRKYNGYLFLGAVLVQIETISIRV